MTLFDYRAAVELTVSRPPFDALVMAAALRADSRNLERLATAFPGLVAETQQRYRAPGGVLEADQITSPVEGSTALVIPADSSQPCRTALFTPRGLLGVLYREIGCDTVQTLSLHIDGLDPITVWVDEDGRYADPLVLNERYVRLNAGLGGPVTPILGTVVLTGGDDDEGTTLGLCPDAVRELRGAIDGATQ